MSQMSPLPTAEEPIDVVVGRRVHTLMWDSRVKNKELGELLGIDPTAVGKKCVNHIQTPRTSGLCLACGMVCTDPTHDADYHKLADVDPENRRER